MIEFEDGTVMEAEDWTRILSIIKQRAKEGKSKPVEIKSEGVTVKVKGYEPKANGKGPAYSNFIESKYQGWTIRVWRIEKDKMYGCNYYRGEDIRYFELRYQDVKDENGVFKYAQGVIDEL